MTTPKQEKLTPSRSSQLTCISCRMLFQNAEEQRVHYKSDIHRFNLKRKVSNLPPVSQEGFEEKIAAVMNTPTRKVNARKDAKKDTDTDFMCTLCKKHYSSANTLAQHLKSKRHQETLAASSSENALEPVKVVTREEESSDTPMEEMATENLTEEELIDARIKGATRLGPEDCIFCSHKSQEIQENLQHMQRVHGFFVPDQEYLQDLPGLLAYLADRVTVGWECVGCGKPFLSCQATQRHMLDAHHCRLSDSDDGADEFYDFSPAWEGIPGSAPEVPKDREVNVSESGWELRLPGGRVAGHREIRHFYRQRLPPPPSAAVTLSRSETLLRLGTVGPVGPVGPVGTLATPGGGLSRGGGVVLTKRWYKRDQLLFLRLGTRGNKLAIQRPQLLQN